MNSRERVKAVLNHQKPDRVPIDLGGANTTGLHASCVAGLREFYGLEAKPVTVYEPSQMLGWVDGDLKEAMGIDTEQVFPMKTNFGFRNADWKPWRMPDGLEVLVAGDFNTTVNTNGDILMYPQGDTSAPPCAKMPKDGYFFDAIIRQEPIQEDQLNPEDNLEEFGPVSEDELAYLDHAIARTERTGRAVTASFGGTAFGDIARVPGPALKHPKGIRDITEWYMSTVSRVDYIKQVFDKQCEIALRNLARIAALAADRVDVVFICGTDFGTQTSAFCSVDQFRELYKPYYERVNRWIHENTQWKTLKHSCGSVQKFLDDFIDCGFDIFNPVQCSAANMEPSVLKDRFGDRLVFWGGGVDTQKTLPFGAPDDVRKEVTDRLRIFSQNGGYVFNPVHNIQARTPIKNIIAMIEAVHAFNNQ